MLAVDRLDGKWYEFMNMQAWITSAPLHAVPALSTHTFSRLVRMRTYIKNGIKAKEADDNQINLKQRSLVLLNEQITCYKQFSKSFFFSSVFGLSIHANGSEF